MACGAKKEEGGAAQDSLATSSKGMLFNIDSVQQEIDNAIQFQRQELRTDPDKIAGYLARLDHKDIMSIPLAAHFIEGYPESPGAPVYDTLYTQFIAVFSSAALQLDSMMNAHPYIEILDKELEVPQDPQVRNLLAYFELYGVMPAAGEGAYEAVADPEFFFNIFGKKASPALHDYLVIKKKEQAEGFAVDAGLTIEYPQLYERIELWGKFMKDHPGHELNREALSNYNMYMQTLLVGMDNTPTFENGVLSSDVKKLYEAIQQQGKDSVSRKIVTDYYAYLSKDGFKQRDQIYEFMGKYDLNKAFKVPAED